MQEKEINLQEHIYEKGQKVNLHTSVFKEINNLMYQLANNGSKFGIEGDLIKGITDLVDELLKDREDLYVDAQLFLKMNNFMYQIINEGQQASYLEVYPKESKENFVLDGDNQVLDNVEIEYKEYPNMASFTNQQPIWTLSPTAAKAKELAFLFGEMHKENIINGVTVKRDGGNLPKTD